jgi:hypothetical protein
MTEYQTYCELRGFAVEGKGCTLQTLRYCAKKAGQKPPGTQHRDCTSANVETLTDGASTADGLITYDAVTFTRRITLAGTTYIFPHIYLDPENGDDTWDGSCGYRKGATVQGPKKTRAGVEAHAAFLANVASGVGVTIGIIASDTIPWREGFDYYDGNARNGDRRITRISLVPYGGRYRQITGLNVVPKGNFTADATAIANAYQFTFTPDTNTGGVNALRMWVDGEPSLVRVSTRAACSAPGTYWYNAPFTDNAPTLVVVHLWADADPRAVSVCEVTARDYAFAAGDACYVEGIHGRATVANNGSLALYNDGYVKRCIWEEGHKHNVVYGPGGEMSDTVILNCQNSTDYQAIGNMLVCFTGIAGARNAKFTRTYWINDPTGAGYVHSDAGIGGAQHFYSHSGDGGTQNITFDSCAWTGGFTAMSGEHASTTFTNPAWFGLPLQTGTAQMFTPASPTHPIVVRGGLIAGKFSRLFDTSHIDIEGTAIISVQGPVIASSIATTAGSTLRLVNNIVVTAGLNITDWAISTTGTILITGNVFSGFYYAHQFTGAIDPQSIVIDKNFYDWVYIGATSGAHIASYKGTIYGTLAAWKAAPIAPDANSAEGNASGSMWISGANPNVTTADIRINPVSLAYGMSTSQITQAAINECLSRPRTYATGIAYVKTNVAATPVWDNMA